MEPSDSEPPQEEEPPPPLAPGQDFEPLALAVVFLLPPILLGGTAITVAIQRELTWNALGIGLVVGLVLSIVFFFVVRRIFENA